MVNHEIKELINANWREQVAKILKWRRDELAVKILYNTGVDEKIYSECDFWKNEIKILTRLLSLPKVTVEIEEEITQEELIAKESDQLDVGNVDELFVSH